jgi:tRNA U34 5-methylaminomethyl-2-thiouridine-forming methyltransferase MnmC
VQLEVITTADGSSSIFHHGLNETYHSRHGAMRESKHVFIQHGLLDSLGSSAPTLQVLEVGFGTGLNALLTWQAAREAVAGIFYTALETYPLPRSIWQALSYGADTQMASEFARLHEARWNETVVLHPRFRLHKVETALQQFETDQKFDVIYFDAFAPARQPELWTLDALKRTTDLLKPAGVWVTYCAKGQLKRDLRQLGLAVETLPGPPGKREMVRGRLPHGNF